MRLTKKCITYFYEGQSGGKTPYNWKLKSSWMLHHVVG